MPTSDPSTRNDRLVDAGLAAAAMVFTLKQLVLALYLRPGYDEVEFLHAGWLLAHGKQVFVEFFEHHSPLLFWFLSQILDVDSAWYAPAARLIFLGMLVLSAILFARGMTQWLGLAQGAGRRRVAWIAYIAFLAVIVASATDVNRPDMVELIRPETVALLAVILAWHAGRYVGAADPWRAWPACFAWIGAALLSVALTPRALPAAIILILMWEPALVSFGQRIRLWAVGLACVAAIAVAHLSFAPPFELYDWLVAFNGMVRPTHRIFPWGPGILSIALSLAIVLGRLYFEISARARDPRSMAYALGNDRRLRLLEALIVVQWVWVLVDRRWFAYSFTFLGLFVVVWYVTFAARVLVPGDRAPAIDAASPPGRWKPVRLRATPVVALAVCLMLWTTPPLWKPMEIYRFRSVWAAASDLSAAVSTPEKAARRLDESAAPISRFNLERVHDLGAWVLASQGLCAALHGQAGLFEVRYHPVCADDASYYWFMPEILTTMHLAGSPFEYYHDFDNIEHRYNPTADILRARPAVIVGTILDDGGNTESGLRFTLFPNPELEALLRRDYVDIKWASVRRDVVPMLRLSTADGAPPSRLLSSR